MLTVNDVAITLFVCDGKRHKESRNVRINYRLVFEKIVIVTTSNGVSRKDFSVTHEWLYAKKTHDILDKFFLNPFY